MQTNNNILFIEPPHKQHLVNIKNYKVFTLDIKQILKNRSLDEAVLFVCRYIKENNIDILLPVFNDKYQTIAKQITQKAGIKGFDNDICLNKYKTYEKIYSSSYFPKLKTFIFDINAPIKTIKSTIQTLSFPIVLKPNNGSGAMGVRIIKNTKQLHKAINSIQKAQFDFAIINQGVSKQFLLQEFVKGKTLYAGGFVANDKFYPLITQQREYTKFPHRYIIGTYNINSDKYYHHLENIAKILDIKDTFLDMEFIENENGIYPIDIHTRVGGFLFDYFENREISRIELFLNTLKKQKLIHQAKYKQNDIF